MTILVSAFIFIFGLLVGSFLNAYIYRLEKGESVMKGRSYCPQCRHQLSWQDLIPLLSFLFLRGRCRYCRGRISWQYPFVEISTALIFLSILHFEFLMVSEFSHIFIPETAYLFFVASLLIVLFVYDLKHYILPDKILFPAIALSIVWLLTSVFYLQLHTTYYMLYTIYSAVGAGAFFLLIFLSTRGRGMGFGDVKLAFFMGLFLSWPNILVALFVAFLLGAIIGVSLILLGRKKMRSEVPFGPFLIAAVFIALFWGDSLFALVYG